MATRESGPGNPARNTGSTSTHRRATWRSTLEAPMTSSDLVNSLCCCPTKWRVGSAAKPVAVGACRGREGPLAKAGALGSRTNPILPLTGQFFRNTGAAERDFEAPDDTSEEKTWIQHWAVRQDSSFHSSTSRVERLITSPLSALPDFSSLSPSLAAYRILINDRQFSPRTAAQDLSPFALVPNICPPCTVQANLCILFR